MEVNSLEKFADMLPDMSIERLEMTNKENFLVLRRRENVIPLLSIHRLSLEGAKIVAGSTVLSTASVHIGRNVNFKMLKFAFSDQDVKHVRFVGEKPQPEAMYSLRLVKSVHHLYMSVVPPQCIKNLVFYRFNRLSKLELVFRSFTASDLRLNLQALEFANTLEQFSIIFRHVGSYGIYVQCNLKLDLSNGMNLQNKVGFNLPRIKNKVKLIFERSLFEDLDEVSYFRKQIVGALVDEQTNSCKCSHWKLLEEGNFECIKNCFA